MENLITFTRCWYLIQWTTNSAGIRTNWINCVLCKVLLNLHVFPVLNTFCTEPYLGPVQCLNNNDNSQKHNNFLRFFPWWKSFLCGLRLFVKLQSKQSKQSCNSFFLVCSTNKRLGLSIKRTSVCTRIL